MISAPFSCICRGILIPRLFEKFNFAAAADTVINLYACAVGKLLQLPQQQITGMPPLCTNAHHRLAAAQTAHLLLLCRVHRFTSLL